jgi:hypothetical protein
MSGNIIRPAGRLLLLILPLMIATGASATVTLPTGNFTCGLFAPPYFGSTEIQSCLGSAAQATAPGNPGIQGVSLGTSSGVTWNVAGSDAGGTQIIDTSADPQTISDSLIMTTSGTVGGSGSFVGIMPLHYDFTITPGSVTCATSNPCNVDVSWNLNLEVFGPAVGGGEVAAPLAFGSSTGHFTGDTSMPHAFSPFVTPAPLTVYSGADLTVYSSLTLTATLPPDAQASFGVTVPEADSFDFQTAENTPEPATMGLLAAGLLLFGYRRLTPRS